jgi:hypothetical protein
MFQRNDRQNRGGEMSAARQAIAARRKARFDPRYSRLANRDAATMARKQREKLERVKMMTMRKGKK